MNVLQFSSDGSEIREYFKCAKLDERATTYKMEREQNEKQIIKSLTERTKIPMLTRLYTAHALFSDFVFQRHKPFELFLNGAHTCMKISEKDHKIHKSCTHFIEVHEICYQCTNDLRELDKYYSTYICRTWAMRVRLCASNISLIL